LFGSMQVLLDRMLVSNNIGWADRNRWTTRPSLHRECLKILGKVLAWDLRILGLGTKKRRHIVATLDCQQMRIGACIGRSAVLGGMGCHYAVVEIRLLVALPATRGQEAEGHSDSEQYQTGALH
jgi:hypothetical protein